MPRQEQNERRGPAHEVRLGTIKATIWGNSTQNGFAYNVVLKRIYRQNDEWRETDSVGRDDLLQAALCLQQAYLWIQETLAQARSAEAA